MTWEDLAKLIAEMPAARRNDPAVLVADYHGPDRRAVYLELIQAWEDVYVGISVGNEFVLSAGEFFLADSDEELEAEDP